jgi:hypothetical protein
LEIALVAPEVDPLPGGGRTPPQAPPLLYVRWSAESGHLSYGVGSQSFSEPAGAIGPAQRATSHDVRITVDSAQRVTFSIDGAIRWQSSLRLLGRETGLRGQLWIGGHATSDWRGAVTGVRAELTGGDR